MPSGYLRKAGEFFRAIFGKKTAKTAAELDGVLDLTMTKKILVIDDDSDLLHLMSQCLKKKGYEVACGLDGKAALDLAARLIPDLIIIDVKLPSMNGDKAARILKKDERLKHIPLILMSSEHEGLDKKSAASEADAYLNKPFDLNELSGMVNTYCASDTHPRLAS